MRLSKPFFLKALIFVAGLSAVHFLCILFSLLRPLHGLLLRCSRAFQGMSKALKGPFKGLSKGPSRARLRAFLGFSKGF